MGLMRTAAVKGIIPAGNKVTELRNNLMRLMTMTAVVMEERFGQDGLDAVAEVFRRLGEEDAKALKDRLGLDSALKDALDAWIVIGNIMGTKIETNWVSENHVETDHPFCPQHASFLEIGRLYCEPVCQPYVGAVATGIAQGSRMEVPRPATLEKACKKAIVLTDK